jgi:amino acid adenylation domain-containing protein
MSDSLKHAFSLPPDQQAIRNKCFHPSGSFVEFSEEEIEQSIPERFEKIVAQYPGRIAIKTRDKSLTYSELNQAANRIAHAILDKHGEGNYPVAILIEHGAEVLVAILGALKAGKIYVPLDPSYPLERLRFILRDAGANLIVTDHKQRVLSSEVAGHECQVMNAEEIKGDVAPGGHHTRVTPDALAYILYTSGSTGQPKGVVDNHRNVLHDTLRLTNCIHLSVEDRLSFTHSCSSSASVRRIFPALLNGASLFPFNVREGRIDGLFNLIGREEITWASLGRIRDIVRNLDGNQRLHSLRLVSFGGEVVHRTEMEIWKKLFPANCVIGMWLSATETGNITQLLVDQQSRISDDILPVGYPTEGMQIMLLDDAGQPLPDGEVGEIAVKSRYLSPGYWQRPDLTKEKFLADSHGRAEHIYLTGDLGRRGPDGCLFHLGRKDDQVKIRGYRVEVAETEAALFKVSGIKKAVVTARERGLDNQVLVAYLMTERRPAPTVTELRRTLAKTLPEHMIPSVFVIQDHLPLTPTGKVDKRSLPDPGKERPELDTAYVPPTTPIEEKLAEIWSEVLSLDQVGICDSFFDLGGHSLIATRLVSKVIERFQLELPLQSLFATPTIAEMAAVIAKHQAKKIGEPELDRILAELESISEEKARQLLADATGKTTTGEADE